MTAPTVRYIREMIASGTGAVSGGRWSLARRGRLFYYRRRSNFYMPSDVIGALEAAFRLSPFQLWNFSLDVKFTRDGFTVLLIFTTKKREVL